MALLPETSRPKHRWTTPLPPPRPQQRWLIEGNATSSATTVRVGESPVIAQVDELLRRPDSVRGSTDGPGRRTLVCMSSTHGRRWQNHVLKVVVTLLEPDSGTLAVGGINALASPQLVRRMDWPRRTLGGVGGARVSLMDCGGARRGWPAQGLATVADCARLWRSPANWAPQPRVGRHT